MADNKTAAGWKYDADDAGSEKTGSDSTPRESGPTVTWTASEFIDRSKGSGWYAAFFGGLALLAILIFIFTRDYISAAVIILAGGIFAFLAKRKPQELSYEINDQGIQIGPKFYEYTNFKSFAIGEEGAVRSIELMPLKRFMPDISIYFPPEQEDAIMNVLSGHLAHDHQMEKAVDKLARKLRF